MPYSPTVYPIIDDLLRQRDQGIREGITAILVYPMNALANDQLDRLRDMLGGTGITFGQWVGTTPDKESDVTVERFAGSARQAYLAARKQRRDEAQAEDRAVRPLAPPEECCSEEDRGSNWSILANPVERNRASWAIGYARFVERLRRLIACLRNSHSS